MYTLGGVAGKGTWFGKQIGIRFQARSLFSKTGVAKDEEEANKQLLQDNDVCKLFFSFDVKMARFGLDLQDTNKVKFDSAKEVAREFLDAFRTAFPDASLEEYEKAWFSEEKEKVVAVAPAAAATSQATSTVESSSVSLNLQKGPKSCSSSAKAKPAVGLYELDKHGKTIDGMGRLRAAGFEMGHEVAETEDGEVWEIEGAKSDAPGSVSVIVSRKTASPEKDGVLIVKRQVVALDTFLASWKGKKAKSEIRHHKGWPEKRTVIRQCALLRGSIGNGAFCWQNARA